MLWLAQGADVDLLAVGFRWDGGVVGMPVQQIQTDLVAHKSKKFAWSRSFAIRTSTREHSR
jgi:hypothetical protein